VEDGERDVNSIVNLTELPRLIRLDSMQAVITMNLDDPLDRSTYIMWLKSLVPANPADQFNIDRCIQAAGGIPEHPPYEVFQQ